MNKKQTISEQYDMLSKAIAGHKRQKLSWVRRKFLDNGENVMMFQSINDFKDFPEVQQDVIIRMDIYLNKLRCQKR